MKCTKSFLALSLIILSALLPIAICTSAPMAEVIDINYPKEASAGQQIYIYVTVDFWISSEPEGLFVCIQNMDDYKDVEVFGATMPSPFVLEQREPMGPLPKGPTTKIYRFSYDVPLYAKYELILAAEAYLLYRGDPKVGHDWELRLADTKSFKIVISPEVKPSGELLTNGGFDQGTIGWKAFGNETPTSANTYITVFGHEGEGLAVNFQLGRSKIHHSSGVSQVIEEKMPLDLKLGFWTKIKPFDATVNPSTLTQLSLEFEGMNGNYRINYIVTKITTSLTYRDRLENEEDIFVTEDSTDWQFIERNVKNDFFHSFGPSEQTFNRINLIIEQASIASMSPPVVYFDQISLTKETSVTDFRLSISPSSITVKHDEKASFDIDVKAIESFDQQVILTALGLPKDASSEITVSSEKPPFKSTLTINIPSTTLAGNYSIIINAAGGGIARSKTVALIVEKEAKQQNALTISASYQDGKITVSGILSSSVKGAEVTLSYHRPDGRILTHEKTVKSDGSFRDVYVPDESGIWSVDAKWAGNDEFTPATSGSINFTVEEKPWYCSFLEWLPDSLRGLFGCR